MRWNRVVCSLLFASRCWLMGTPNTLRPCWLVWQLLIPFPQNCIWFYLSCPSGQLTPPRLSLWFCRGGGGCVRGSKALLPQWCVLRNPVRHTCDVDVVEERQPRLRFDRSEKQGHQGVLPPSLPLGTCVVSPRTHLPTNTWTGYCG